jgi:hypothetical protein
MAELKQPRRVEEVAPGLVRLVDGDTYVYLSASNAEMLADKWKFARANPLRGDASARAMAQQGSLNA